MRSWSATDLAHRREVVGLPPVVELVDQRLAELLQQLRQAVAAAGLGVLVEQVGEVGEDLHVLAHLLPDAGPLHLDDDLAAVAQRRPVDLAERGRGERRAVEGREDLGEPHLRARC